MSLRRHERVTLRGIAWARVLFPILLLLVPTAASAQNVLSVAIGGVVRPGASNVVIPINLTSVEELTLLRFDLTFDPSLCAQLTGIEPITIRKMGRTAVAAEDEHVACESGEVRVGVLGLDGAPVIPPGTGPIIEIGLGGLQRDAAGTFPLTLQTVFAHRGPRTLPITASGGELSIHCLAAGDCDDANSCTDDTCNQTSHLCIHSCKPGCQCACPLSPSAGCVTPGRGRLQLEHSDRSSRNKLLWSFSAAPTLPQGGFGNPTATTSYILCAYDDGVLKLSAAVGPSATQWVALGFGAYQYVDSTGTQAGITSAKLLPSLSSIRLIRLTGKGSNLSTPTPVSPARLFAATTNVQAQLHQSDGGCYETTFTPQRVLKNDGSRFKARF